MISGTIISKLTNFYSKLEGNKIDYTIVINLKPENNDEVDYYLLKDFNLLRPINFLQDIYQIKFDFILNRDLIVQMFLVKKIKYFAELYEKNPNKLFLMIIPNNDADDFAVLIYVYEKELFDENCLLQGTALLNENGNHIKIYAEQLVDM